MFNALEDIFTQATAGGSPTEKVTHISTLTDLLGVGANIVIAIAFSMSLVGLAYGFVLYVMSTGDPKNTQKAFQLVLYSLIGLVVTVLSFALKTAFINTVGVTDANYTNALPTF